MNKILNVLIGLVLFSIIIIASMIFKGGDENKDENKIAEENEIIETEETAPELGVEPNSSEQDETDEPTEEADGKSNTSTKDKGTESNEDDSSNKDSEDVSAKDKDTVVVTEPTADEDIVSNSIVDAAWQPVVTEQTGEHVSSYDAESIDFSEKKQAIAYATGNSVDTLIFWKIKNGGSPQKSVGIVESKVDSEKYRVYIEWIEGQGWKPMKIDVLKTLDFEY